MKKCFLFFALLWFSGLFVFAEDGVLPTATDVSTKKEVPTPLDLIPLERLETLAARNADAQFDPNRVITPPMPIAIRQEGPQGPTYQEGSSYTFLVHSMKFASMCRLGDGRIAMAGTGWTSGANQEERGCFISYSDDEAYTWSQPIQFHRGLERPQPVFLGGSKLLLLPMDDDGFLSFSDDNGVTWKDKHPFPRLPDGRITYHKGSVLVEEDVISAVFYVEGEPRGSVGWSAYSLLRRSRDAGRTWNEGIWLPPEWHTSEGSIARAADGALVVSLRTAQPDKYPSFSDHWRRITTARSMDEGRTWSDHQVHFKYGKVHSDLIRLQDGRLLMTYAARMGELENKIYHGIEAVISRDDGKTWDWSRRFTLFRWAMHQSMHSPCSLQLKDGRILTLFLYHYGAQWGDRSVGGSSRTLGITSAVIWSPDGSAPLAEKN
ncbi:MAG: glycoside hydrolase [Pirellulaceae bacterium]|nr:glycoside hydrolase [Pirellulaceae bacterium]